jgi:hypothetical protein
VFKGWRRNLAAGVAILAVLLIGSYAIRCTLLLNIARIALSRDADLVAQERKDGVAIAFPGVDSIWVKPLKNLMNPIWSPIDAEGVNYFTFAGPANVLRNFSERSNPRSPYYQAWVGGYVTKLKRGILPSDLPQWASQVTALDQRSWLAAMGDSAPVADFGAATPVGEIVIDGHELPLWQGSMKSHSDLSERPRGPLATLLGMPPKSTWPAGTHEFHDLTLEGYFACWSDSTRNISVVIYAVAAVEGNKRDIKEELLSLMKSASVQPIS